MGIRTLALNWGAIAVCGAAVPLAGHAQLRPPVEAQIEAGGILGAVTPEVALAEGIDGWSYGVRLGGTLSRGRLVAGGEVASLSFIDDAAEEGPRYRTAAYLGSLSLGARSASLTSGRYEVRVGAGVGATAMKASRSERGWRGSTDAAGTASGALPPEPEIGGGGFVEPVIQFQGREVGAAVRYRIYDPSSSVRSMLLVGWHFRLGSPFGR